MSRSASRASASSRNSSAAHSLERMIERVGSMLGQGDREEDEIGVLNDPVDSESLDEGGEPSLSPKERRELDKHVKFTNEHPLGKLWIGMIKDNIAMREKLKYPQSHVSLQDFCTGFYLDSERNKATWEAKLKQTEQAVRNKLIHSKLQNHDMTNSFPAPEEFGEHPSLKSAAAFTNILKLFPSGSQKFSGNRGNGKEEASGPTVVEYLAAMNRGQETAKLSREEFANAMLSSTTGRAHLLLLDWFQNGESIEDAYHSLMVNFDRRVTIDEARVKLAAYKASKTSNLGKVAADIMQLARRASTSLPMGPARTAFYNLEATMALIRALPPTSSALASNTFHSFSAELGTAATFSDFCKALTVYKVTIDQDIRQHGVDFSKGKNREQNNGHAGNSKKGGQGKGRSSSYSVNAGSTASTNLVQADQGKGSQPQQGNQNGSRKKFYNNKGKKKGNGNSQQKSGPQGGVYCNLCGNVDHKASDGCPFIRADNGMIIKYHPTQSVCSKCPPSVQPRLNHGERVCPFRKGGVLEGTAL